jgi:serine/threonine-protein kinase
MHLLHTLGPTALFDPAAAGDGHVAVHAKRLALLIFLARGGRGPFLRRDVLLALLWPDTDQAHGRAALRQTLTGLRRQLGSDAILTRGEHEVGLAPQAVSCDATEFERECAAGNHTAAAALYQGDFAAGFHLTRVAPEFEQWVDGERLRLRRLAVQAARGAAADSERAGHPAEAEIWARRAVELAPEDEASVAQLITLLDHAGDRSGALAAYDALARRLAEEYSAEPSPETRELIDAVRARRGPHHPGIQSADATETPSAIDRHEPTGAAPVAPAAQVRRPSRRKLLLVSAAAGAVLVLALAAVLAWVRRPAPPPGALMAVMPFRVNAADASFAWLREGMVELLAIRLTGEGGMQIVEPERLLTAWHQRVPADRSDVPDEAVWSLAAGIGAGRIIQGSVTGTSHSLALSAWVLAPGGRELARASVEGPPDSLPFLVDRLAARLLGVSAGIEGYQLASFTSSSLPAIRAFLAGRTAFRTGRMEEALQRFLEAVELDSNFALAALDLFRTTGWVNSGPNAAIGERRAVAGRDRLSRADQALLDLMRNQGTSAPTMFASLNMVTTAYPDRPETWYGLGDAYYHLGRLAGIEGSLERAEDAFRRGWQLDSAAEGKSALARAAPLVAEPMSHMVELAHMRGDTAEVRRLVTRVLGADSSSDLARELRWHLALIDGDSARRTFWDGIGTATQTTTMRVVLFIVWSGVGGEDLPRAMSEDARRLRLHDPGYAKFAQRVGALNSGRPSDVPAVREAAGNLGEPALRSRIRDAMSWEGDSAAAIAAVRELTRYVNAPATGASAIREQDQDICALGQWRLAHGDLSAAEAASRRLHAARLPGLQGRDSASFAQSIALCAALLDASLAFSRSAATGAQPAIALADSLARSFIFQVCCVAIVSDANLRLAELWERSGNLPNALRALRRGSGKFVGASLFISTFLREEGRVAALAGDTAGAIRAYRHYLALRYDPEPSLRPAVDRVRGELVALGPLAVAY